MRVLQIDVYTPLQTRSVGSLGIFRIYSVRCRLGCDAKLNPISRPSVIHYQLILYGDQRQIGNSNLTAGTKDDWSADHLIAFMLRNSETHLKTRVSHCDGISQACERR